MVRRQSNKYAADYLADGSLQVNVNFSSVCKLCRSINQSINQSVQTTYIKMTSG